MPKPFFLRKLVERGRDGKIDSGGSPETDPSDSRRSSRQEISGYDSDTDVTLHEEQRINAYGLSLLNTATGQSTQKYDLDVIAVHGLGGHAYRTWTHDNGKLWLRDFLSEDISGVRVFTYGYNSTFVFSRETGNLRDYARDLLENIRSVRTHSEEKDRSLCFVCHSMGGIVVKQAILIAKNESDLFSDITSSVSGILFLATPHQGSPFARYVSILSQIANTVVVGSQLSRLKGLMRTDLLRGLKTKESQLLDIAQDFRVHTATIQIVSFIEQKNMRGLNERIVDEKSGYVGAEKERIISMADCDHREICVYAGRTSNYKKLLGAIRECITLSQRETRRPQAVQSTLTSLQINVPQQRVANFVARETLLAEMKVRVMNDSPSLPVVLIGMGGSGKTQLALEFCRQAEESLGFMAVIWIDASSPVSVKQAYELIAKKISDNQPDSVDTEAIISFVRDTLQNWDRRWLVVFDNYDNLKAFQSQGIRHYLPSGKNGRILFTSRHEDAARLGHRITVSGMSEQESINLLLQRPSIDESEKAEGLKIVSTLGHLALALDQAGAYIRARNLKLKDFISHYLKRKDRVLKEIPDEWEYRKETSLSIFTTWELSFEQIGGDDEEREQKGHFLTLAAFLDNTNISERYFQAYFNNAKHEWMNIFGSNEEWDSEKLGDVLAELQRLSLLQMPNEQINELRFSLHPVVRDWIKLRQSIEMRRQFAQEALMMLSSFLNDINLDNLSLVVKQETILHLDSCLGNDQEFLQQSNNEYDLGWLSMFSWFYLRQGRYDEAELLFKRALADDEEKQGLEHLDTRQKMTDLAFVYLQTNRYDEVEKLLNRALISKEKSLGLKHSNMIVTVENLMKNFANEEHYNEEEKCLMLQILKDLVVVYNLKGRYDEAEKLSNRIMTAIENLDLKDLNQLSTMEAMARFHVENKRYDEAEALYRRLLIDREEKLNLKHSDTLRTVELLANVLRFKEQYDEAEALYRRALISREETLGLKHSGTLLTVESLANVLWLKKQFDEAEALCRRALIGREEMLGLKHSDTLRTVEMLANVLMFKERHDEAEELCRRVLNGREEKLRLKHLDTLLSVQMLAGVLMQKGQYDEAEELHRRMLSGIKETLGLEHPNTLKTVEELAYVLACKERYDEEEELFRRVLSGREKTLGLEHPDTVRAVENLGRILEAMNRPEEAMQLRSRINLA